jgi:hypothetical protein
VLFVVVVVVEVVVQAAVVVMLLTTLMAALLTLTPDTKLMFLLGVAESLLVSGWRWLACS